MSIQVKMGQFWQSSDTTRIYEIVKLESVAKRYPFGTGSLWIWVKTIDKASMMVLDPYSLAGQTNTQGEMEWFDWTLLQAAPEDMHTATTIPVPPLERACKNKTCGKMNDLGVKSCWLCGCPNPTDY